MDRVQPEAGHPEPGEVVEPVDETGEVTDPVAVGVLEGVDVDAVDDGLAEPAFGHDVWVRPIASGATADEPRGDLDHAR